MVIRRYSELIQIPTFNERFEYCRTFSKVGADTFGLERALNQGFYNSAEWESVRNYVIARDGGCDLAMPGHEILPPDNQIVNRKYGPHIIVHHLNPIKKEDIINGSKIILDPEFLICVSEETHKAIHYGGIQSLGTDYADRNTNDTCPWRNK